MGNKQIIKGLNITLTLVVVILIFIVLYMAYTQKISFTKKAPIKIGFVGSLESKQSEASQALEAIKIAVNEINNLGGIDGSKIELVAYNPNSEEEVKFYFEKIANEDKALAIISTFADSSDAVEKLKIPTILIGQNMLTPQRKEPFYWSLTNSYVMGDYLLTVLSRIDLAYDVESIVVLTDGTSFMHNNGEIMKGIMKQANLNHQGSYAVDEKNLNSIVADIKNKNPDVVLISANEENAIKFFKEANKQGIKPKVYLGDFEIFSNLLENDNILPENLYILKSPTLSLSSYPSIRSNNPAILQSINKFDSVNEKLAKATGKPMTTIGLNAYDSVYIIKDAIEKSNVINTENALNQYREEIISNLWKTKSFESLRGDIYPDGKTGFLRRTYSTIMVVEDSKLKVWDG